MNQEEELWSKSLPEQVEKLLSEAQNPLVGREIMRGDVKTVKGAPRDKTRCVTYQVPHNAAVQVYDYKSKQARWVLNCDVQILLPLFPA